MTDKSNNNNQDVYVIKTKKEAETSSTSFLNLFSKGLFLPFASFCCQVKYHSCICIFSIYCQRFVTIYD